jgi:hypothetical protein
VECPQRWRSGAQGGARRSTLRLLISWVGRCGGGWVSGWVGVSRVCVCVCACACVFEMHVCVRERVCVCNAHTTHTHMHTHTHTHTRKHTHTHTHKQTDTRNDIHIYIKVCAACLKAATYTYLTHSSRMS